MNRTCEQRSSLKENGEKDTYLGSETELKFLAYMMRKDGLKNLTHIAHIDNKGVIGETSIKLPHMLV